MSRSGRGSSYFVQSGSTDRIWALFAELRRSWPQIDCSGGTCSHWVKVSSAVDECVDCRRTAFRGDGGTAGLECAASVVRVRATSKSVRIVAEVGRMTVVKREPEERTPNRSAAHFCAGQSISAISRSQNDNPRDSFESPNHFKSNPTGEHTMSFLKNFLIEEEGQDMVENTVS